MELALFAYCCLAAADIQTAVQPFPLDAVRLEAGIFRDAMERDRDYLLSLNPDRLLAWFRKEAGLEPRAEVYGGWESQGVAGHSLGHYLSACSLMYAATGEEALRERVSYTVSELRACQEANGDGYVGAIPEGKRVFAELRAGDVRLDHAFNLNGLWVPWYTMHKLLAGLLDANRYTANDQALDIADALGDWAVATVGHLDEEKFQRMLGCEHGGITEALAELYSRTGNDAHLALARRFHHDAVLGPLERGEDPLSGLHANTQVPKLIGLARLYEITGDDRCRAGATNFWNFVVDRYTYVNGGNSDNEHFGKPRCLAAHMGPEMTETCNTYNMLKLTKHLFCWQPEPRYADYYERAMYNQILTSQDPKTGLLAYKLGLYGGHFLSYCTAEDSFWCCTGTGMENHARYGEAIYFHDDTGLYVNLYLPSTLRWNDRGCVVRMDTHYPDSEDVSICVTECDAPFDAEIRLRCPGWAESGMDVQVNDEPPKRYKQPGEYIVLQRTWMQADTIRLRLPMPLRIEPAPDNPNRVAVLYGPVVLAGQLGTANMPENGPYGHPSDVGYGLSAPDVPALVGLEKTDCIVPVEGQPLTFRTNNATTNGEDITFKPLFRTHHQRFSVYWDGFTTEEWKAEQERRRLEEERRQALEARTLDRVIIGDEASEEAHELDGLRTAAGPFSGRMWRHADSGGWFGYTLQAPPDQPAELVCTYWGDDTGNRTFNIRVNGETVATQTLNRNAPGEFFDVAYAIPSKAVPHDGRLVVRFEALNGGFAGGVFDLRMMKTE